jgi:transcriptional regulator with XRE-family HTH domain
LQSEYSVQYAKFCQLLIAARKEHGLTQVDLAQRLGAPQPFVSKYERGERRIDLVEFLAIIRSTGADPHEIIRQMEEGR